MPDLRPEAVANDWRKPCMCNATHHRVLAVRAWQYLDTGEGEEQNCCPECSLWFEQDRMTIWELAEERDGVFGEGAR